ncbi:LolA family protein [Desulfobulbus alkaliphilus]|uniref:LolA family protein n=1 Tax=Desulfobulbus alkaliphilus TaxID=869814 RepID=UPI0019640FF0|nr:outer membrane lipoprotein carrier protein LolA [Desulfobulbus alkaliphilus]MBM9537355.1 outer membrane lipoprotein carrier protein LolA [Desulfobulbus alkaliphilus]
MFNSLMACFSLLLLLLLAFPSPSCAAASTLDQRILDFEQQYMELQSLEFDFSQATFSSGRIREGAGNAVFFRPTGEGDSEALTSEISGIMRWNYTEPTIQTIINDGHELFIYTPQDNQLIVSPIDDLEADITYAIFTGTRSLLEAFAAEPPDPFFRLTPAPDTFEAILLTPRQPHPQIRRIQLWFDTDMIMQRLLMEDHFETFTELQFTEIRFNALPADDPQLRQSLLELDLQPSTEIIRP